MIPLYRAGMCKPDIHGTISATGILPLLVFPHVLSVFTGTIEGSRH